MCACVFQLPRVARKRRDATSICDRAFLVVNNTFAFSDFLKLVRRVDRAISMSALLCLHKSAVFAFEV